MPFHSFLNQGKSNRGREAVEPCSWSGWSGVRAIPHSPAYNWLMHSLLSKDWTSYGRGYLSSGHQELERNLPHRDLAVGWGNGPCHWAPASIFIAWIETGSSLGKIRAEGYVSWLIMPGVNRGTLGLLQPSAPLTWSTSYTSVTAVLEFTSVTIPSVYIPPQAEKDRASD